jgi:hypothetical protein
MLLPEDVYENQKNYIETVKKPFNLPVRDFVKRLRQLAAYLPEFPKPQGSTFISDNDMKNIIFRGMPSAWQENFAHANMRITTVTLAQMTDYLASEQVIADTRRENARGRSPHGGRHNNSGRGFIGGRGRGRHPSGRGGRSNHKRSGNWNARSNSSNAASNNPCRYHGNAHTWKMCYGNPDGPIIGRGSRPKDRIPEAEDVEDSTEDVQMEVVGMTHTKMMPLVTMQAIWHLIMQPQFKQVRQVRPQR